MEHQDKVIILQQEIQKFIRLFGALEQNKTPCGFPINITQAHALYELSKVEKMTQNELSEKLMIDKSSVSRLVDTFVKKGFIERSSNPDNRREMFVFLTEKGKRTNNKINQLRRNKYESLLSGIPKEKQEEVVETLLLLNQALRSKL